MVLAQIEHWDFWRMFYVPWYWAGVGGWVVASLIKAALAWHKTRTFDFTYLLRTGGMPSSHSAAVTACAWSLGYTEGFDAPVTILSIGFAIVTMFDAATVRRAAGEHAKILNAIVRDIKEFNLKPKQRFKELLGHTRTEVFWGMIIGIAWATVLCYCWG